MATFPVTASTLSETELGKFIQEKYNLNENFDCKLFRTGVNHTYFLSDTTTKYVVRVYCHQWRTKSEIQEELELLKLLQSHNLSISFPVADKNVNFIQEINAPEGLRYAVVFTFAEGEKIRFMTNETCFAIGSLMAKIHNITATKTIDRIVYDSDILLNKSYDYLTSYFSEALDEMKYLKETGTKISRNFEKNIFSENQKGIVHLDIWYDNLSVNAENEITIFDFDNCGNGWLILDIGYFCKQLFFIESDKNIYESKVESFLNGYRKERNLSDSELQLIPDAGASIFVFYLGVQAQRFDWSNIFFTENYLKMFVVRIKNWIDYHANKKIEYAK
ncbi:MAG: homoserine kinase [Chryseobacterium sp.]|nr:homoserine kinase [Chryseobacterium sp.]